jgi:hypothetical protein
MNIFKTYLHKRTVHLENIAPPCSKNIHLLHVPWLRPTIERFESDFCGGKLILHPTYRSADQYIPRDRFCPVLVRLLFPLGPWHHCQCQRHENPIASTSRGTALARLGSCKTDLCKQALVLCQSKNVVLMHPVLDDIPPHSPHSSPPCPCRGCQHLHDYTCRRNLWFSRGR